MRGKSSDKKARNTASLKKRVGHVAAEREIAQRKLAEEALRESESRLQRLSDNLPDGMVYQIDSGEDGRQRRFSYISAGVERLHGVAIREALSNPMSIYGQVMAKDRLRLADEEAFALEHMVPLRTELRVQLPSGEIRWRLFASAPRRLPNNHLVWDGIELDITERKRAEEALLESEERYRRIVELSPDAIYIQCEGNIVFVNTAGVRLLGATSPEQLIGMQVLNIIHPDYRKIVRERIRQLKEEGTAVPVIEERYLRLDGTSVDVEVAAAPIIYRGKPGAQVMVRDITERKKLEGKLQTEARNLEEVNIALKVLLKKMDEEKTELEEKVVLNVKEMTMPYMEKLKKSGLDERQKTYVSILEASLEQIISPFSLRMSSQLFNLTPKELQVANLLKQGKTNKEIAEILHSSPRTIACHREGIRKKLGLRNKKANLKSYLLSIS